MSKYLIQTIETYRADTESESHRESQASVN